MSVSRVMRRLLRLRTVVHMTESDESSKKKPGLGVALGIAIGLPIGAGAGMLLFDNVGVGAALGLALGVALGAAWESSGRGEKSE
ncbi:ElaB/YqjD/DUF883 family membrane-anchored ribosome-binding protein [Microbacterium murale]|uniref:ElaB/YqjD/DUF883 family membrane-anchored ribosome-binding protein n=2 Tax=Microbacterium murale TaxID=1081040 RepID=A0ABU0P4W4_9MICO|nr:ElaB/YqjD/DUF883 family membrane-anchored ribosome-binding protein [Microbacterium murale]